MGGRPPVIGDEEFVEFLSDASNPHVRSTREVADHFEMSTQGAIKRLKELQSDGDISGKKLQGVWIWWIPEDDE